MPPWVLYEFPRAGEILKLLRDTPCQHGGLPNGAGERHDPQKELTRWFGFPDFRPEPADEDGVPLQKTIVQRAMAGEHLLAILPTGAGKSVCLPGAGPIPLRQDRRRHSGHLSPGRPDVRPGGQSGTAGHQLLRDGERPAVHAGTRRGAGTAQAGGRRDPADIARTTQKQIGAQRPGPAVHRGMGLGRSPLSLQVGPRLPARLPLHRPVHTGTDRRCAAAAHPLPDRHRQTRRQAGDRRILPGDPRHRDAGAGTAVPSAPT